MNDMKTNEFVQKNFHSNTGKLNHIYYKYVCVRVCALKIPQK